MSEQQAKKSESELEFAAQSTSKEMSQTPQGQQISRSLSSEICSSLYLSNPHTSISLCAAIQSLSPVDFLSFNISGEELSEIAAFDHSPLYATETFFKSTFLWMCQTHKVRTHSNWPSVSPRREKQKSRREDATPAESSINIIPAHQKMVSGLLPHGGGDLETSTSSSSV